MGKITEVGLVHSLLPSQNFLVEAGDDVKRLPLSDLQSLLGKNIFTPEFTLEQNSNVTFDVGAKLMASMYRRAMGGYMFKVVGGKVYAAKLNASNWEYFEDGTKVDNAAKYETMVHVPKCYFKSHDKTMQFGGLFPIEGGHSFDCPEWIGAYKMYVDGTVGHSRPNVAPTHSKNMETFWGYAQNLGSQFGLAGYGFHCLVNALFQASYGNLDSQSVIGVGFQHSNWEACRDVPMGKCISLGDGSGKVLYNDATIGNQYSVKLFGFEDLWGKLWEFRPGIYFYMDGSTRYAVVYSGNRVSFSADGRKFVCLDSANGNYVTKMQLGEYWDMIAQAINGSASSYYCDGYWASTGGELLNVGGRADSGSLCGLSYASSTDGRSYSGAAVCARLAFYGQPVLVSGSELVAM